MNWIEYHDNVKLWNLFRHHLKKILVNGKTVIMDVMDREEYVKKMNAYLDENVSNRHLERIVTEDLFSAQLFILNVPMQTKFLLLTLSYCRIVFYCVSYRKKPFFWYRCFMYAQKFTSMMFRCAQSLPPLTWLVYFCRAGCGRIYNWLPTT